MADEKSQPRRTITIPLPTDWAGVKALGNVLFKIAVIIYLIWSGNKAYDVKTLLTDTVAPIAMEARDHSLANNKKLDAVREDAKEAKESSEKVAEKVSSVDKKADTISRTMLTK